ncbi:hypothetical protein O1611_g2255 [Lasiodiplodia mahajangana]|uniref:Uncharacterized protein n=1 Tax=Lasiodiplodia mahajangana TaxID=1108764 RepID=A0ACC2JVE3_9PEZI|nr:hypothetical protein O1611_g2255 [Lasiodiplodia mahajangana]
MDNEDYDRFYTPENRFFYSQSPYTALDPRRCEIRVVRMFPRKPLREHYENHPDWDRSYMKDLHAETQVLACQIEKTTLTSIAGEYSTISYCAGELLDTELILVNGIPFNAFANLAHAMECVLKNWPRTADNKASNTYRLWIDQICINQSDKNELSEQIQFMREIYRQSEQTFICLSSPMIPDCLSWIPHVPEISNAVPQSKDTPGVTMLKRLLLDFLVGKGQSGIILSSLSQLSTGLKSDALCRQRSSDSINNLVRVPSVDGSLSTVPRLIQRHTTGPELEGFVDQTRVFGRRSLPLVSVFRNSFWNFIENKWWRRSWVYQEFISANSIHFVCGATLVTWAELQPCVKFVCDDLDHSIQQISDDLDHFIQQVSEDLNSRITQETEQRGCKRKIEVLERERQEGRTSHGSELRLREEVLNSKKEERRRKALENKGQQVNGKKLLNQVVQADKEAERIYQQRRQDYYEQLAAFESEQKRQWEIAWRNQNDMRRRYVAEERTKVQREITIMEKSRWESDGFMRKQRRLENFWREVSKPIEDQIKDAWSFKRAEHEALESNRRCGLRLFSEDRVKALFDLDRVPRTPREFEPISTKKPVKPRQHAPTIKNLEGMEGFYSLKSVTTTDFTAPESILNTGRSESAFPPFERRDLYEIVQQRDNIMYLQAKLRRLDRSPIKSMINGKQTFKQSSELKSLLRHSRDCEASDPRDRVYAFLGLAHKEYKIAPNYKAEMTIREVLIETAKGIIRFDKSLDILQDVYRGRDKLGYQLPSWVPDWTSRETRTGLDQHPYEKAGPFDASKGLPADVDFSSATGNDGHQDLKVRGIFLDYIEETESESPDFSGVSAFLTTDGNLILGPKSARSDDEAWVLYGCKTPVILRRNCTIDDAYG